MNPSDILDFWFGPLDTNGHADAEHTQRWWKKDAAFDQLVRDRFLPLHQAVSRHAHDAWCTTPRGRLALVIVLDQLSRNMFRDTAAMFASDAQALKLAQEGIAQGDDQKLAADERSFLYMPLMHTEDLAVQEQSVALFGSLGVASALDFAKRHRDIVQQFGRFPHRNALLGRTSTAAEEAFLKQPGSSF